ncbi:MAG: redoxin domain-containing protein [Candidatus Binatia bacterium]
MVRSTVNGVVAICLILAATSRLCAQQDRNPRTVEGLLKSIGLAKPAMARAPEFSLREMNGNVAALSGYRGKMVLLNFWATWCEPCRDEMPSMEQLSRNFGGQGLAVVAINQRENVALVARFMKTHNLNFSTPLDTDGRVAASYRVYGIPVTYLIDGDGQAIGMKSGPMDWASPKVVDVFRKLIGDGNSGGVTGGSMDLEPATPLPTALRVKGDGVLIRGQQDTQSEVVGKLARGDELVPLGKASGAGEFWYMVKSKNGTVGWVRGADVQDANQRR